MSPRHGLPDPEDRTHDRPPPWNQDRAQPSSPERSQYLGLLAAVLLVIGSIVLIVVFTA